VGSRELCGRVCAMIEHACCRVLHGMFASRLQQHPSSLQPADGPGSQSLRTALLASAAASRATLRWCCLLQSMDGLKPHPLLPLPSAQPGSCPAPAASWWCRPPTAAPRPPPRPRARAPAHAAHPQPRQVSGRRGATTHPTTPPSSAHPPDTHLTHAVALAHGHCLGAGFQALVVDGDGKGHPDLVRASVALANGSACGVYDAAQACAHHGSSTGAPPGGRGGGAVSAMVVAVLLPQALHHHDGSRGGQGRAGAQGPTPPGPLKNAGAAALCPLRDAARRCCGAAPHLPL